MDEIEIIQDETGQERRLGSKMNPAGFVSAYPTFESVFEMWDDQQIRRVITDPNRVPRRKLFGPSWMQNQRVHGSCNGYALGGGLSKGRFLRGIQDKLLLSGAFPYSLMNDNRDNGSLLSDGLKIIERYGSCPESLVPWDMIYRRQQPSNAKAEAAKHKGLICYAAGTLQGLRTGLAKGFLAIVAVHAGGKFQRLNAQGIAGVDSGSGNHAVHVDDLCMVGGTEVFDMANSWGLGYGEEGRAYLTASSFSQTFESHTFYLIGSTEEAD
jgi:hypothetical protein